jgi:hypothetical protein
VRDRVSGIPRDAEALGQALAKKLMAQGAAEILATLKQREG